MFVSGIDVELRNTLDFMISELLAPFADPKDGYIAKNKGALAYSDLNESRNAPGIVGEPVSASVAVAPLPPVDEKVQSDATIEEEASECSDKLKDVAEEPKANIAVESASWFPSFWAYNADTAVKKQDTKDIRAFDSLYWAVRSGAGDTVELTASKVNALITLVEKSHEDMKVPLKIQRLFLNEQEDSQRSESASNLTLKVKSSKEAKDPKEIRVIKDKELGQLKNRIALLQRYGIEAGVKISTSMDRINADRQALKQSTKSPAKADAYLNIWSNMLKWVDAESSLLHICLTFEATPSTESKGELFFKRDSLERKFVTYLFRTMFTLQLDHIKYTQQESTGYTRRLPSAEATKIIKECQETIKTLNNNIALFPGLRRMQQLINLIKSMQTTVRDAFENIESTRYSLFNDSAAEWLPSMTPRFIASTPNQFLIEMKTHLQGFHIDSCTLETSIKLHLDSKETQEVRSRLLNNV